MSDRKRVNISTDPKTYEKLLRIKQEQGFRNVCELVVAFIHILLDRLEQAGHRKYDLPEDDGAYIDEMFEELENVERTPNGDTPIGRSGKRFR